MHAMVFALSRILLEDRNVRTDSAHRLLQLCFLYPKQSPKLIVECDWPLSVHSVDPSNAITRTVGDLTVVECRFIELQETSGIKA